MSKKKKSEPKVEVEMVDVEALNNEAEDLLGEAEEMEGQIEPEQKFHLEELKPEEKVDDLYAHMKPSGDNSIFSGKNGGYKVNAKGQKLVGHHPVSKEEVWI